MLEKQICESASSPADYLNANAFSEKVQFPFKYYRQKIRKCKFTCRWFKCKFVSCKAFFLVACYRKKICESASSFAGILNSNSFSEKVPFSIKC